MHTISRTSFTTVKTEGAILPADLLQRIAEGRDLEGLTPADYHLVGTERLNEAINRAWNRCLGAWTAFDEARGRLPESDYGTTLTRERWLLILFQELGYGRLQALRGAIQVDGTAYSISHQWERTPIHLVSFRQDLDRVSDQGGGTRRKPHSLLQEYLNRAPDALWGFASNGLQLRILRDNVSLTRSAYVEFDLEAMMGGEQYADFALLWLLCHQSRVEGERPEDCWLERWSKAAADSGTRALDALRNGVQEAIAALGRGFLAHPANVALKTRLKSGELTTQDYYRQLLRLVYRLIFLFVAEDRDVLLTPADSSAATTEARRRYLDFYSTRRLRDLAETLRGTAHPDLYRNLRQVLALLRTGYPDLALPALGSFLFSDRATPDLDAADLANQALLDAVRELAFTVEGRVRRPVDYRNLGSEELGSVYESLLELHPQINTDAAGFELTSAAGSERKTTGSYYTPTSLIICLLDSALEPVVEDRLRGATTDGRSLGPRARPDAHKGLDYDLSEAEHAILSLRVVDPACGSGHFLIAAAHRLARHLALARTGGEEPGPGELRVALRDVVGRCIYGVDLNEMAVELCKVGLWLETVEPGKPLSFLDANIQCGNSLIGATPALLKGGIPDEAFTPIEGDDKAYCSEFKKRNKQQRAGQRSLFDHALQPWDRLGDFAASMMSLDELPDNTIEDVEKKRQLYESLVTSSGYEFGRLWADAWCAAFVWKKTPEFAYPITEEVFRKIEKNPFNLAAWMRDEIKRLAVQYAFLHWHLAFPQVFRAPGKDEEPDNSQAGWSGGFDVVLGNPPWEHTELKEEEWFAVRRPDIAAASTGAKRKQMIEVLAKEDPALYREFVDARRSHDAVSHFVRNSGRYPLCGRGRVNTYAVFAESNRLILGQAGCVGCIVPSGIATDDTTKYFFQDLMDSCALVSLYDFENREGIFPGVHRSYKFCLLTFTGAGRPTGVGAEFVFFALDTANLAEPERRFTLSAADMALLNPNTRTCPIFRSRRDAELTKAIYRRAPVLVQDDPTGRNPWGVTFRQGLFNLTGASGLFRSREQLEQAGWRLEANIFVKGSESYLPLYEAKMIHQFDHRWATYNGTEIYEFRSEDKTSSCSPVMGQYWLPLNEFPKDYRSSSQKWCLVYRRVARPTDVRTMIACISPIYALGDKLPIVTSHNGLNIRTALCLLANLNSFCTDYVLRQKIGGMQVDLHYFKQIAIPPPQRCATEVLFISPRVLELTYTAWDLQPFARDCGYDGPPFRWDEERRFLLRCELDAAFFHLYGIARDDVDYIMDAFPIVRRKDEAKHGEYRTKRVILEIYDEMQGAQETGGSYSTRLDPPPADPRVAHREDR